MVNMALCAFDTGIVDIVPYIMTNASAYAWVVMTGQGSSSVIL
jgi:hypothetical protein